MEVQKKYFQDKLILLLASSNVFLAFLAIVLILLRIGQGTGQGFIIAYRSNLGISPFARGTLFDILAFVGFVLVLTVITLLLSMRVYDIKRVLSISLLVAGVVLVLLTLVVSNSLLTLR